ncbi:hypothetical protein DFJ74DRAFT_603195 [Hyaloraphidium curvatum]|nr:hypothetical protein DFJ74DRAFT_603195 [Hyaloraphidium curvatum]
MSWGLGIGGSSSTSGGNPLSAEPLSASSPAGRDLVARTETFVRRLFEGQDASHDFSHVERVRRLAIRIGESLLARGQYANLLTVELAALLHDVADAKYAREHAAKLGELLPGADPERVPAQFLERAGATPELARQVQAVVERVGYRKEIATSKHADKYASNELDCVRDADKLDAIGAIGIARCFAYGGAHGRALHDSGTPRAKTRSAPGGDDCLAHFHDKLLKLAAMMKTDEAKKIAKERHDFLAQFVAQFEKELNGKA